MGRGEKEGRRRGRGGEGRGGGGEGGGEEEEEEEEEEGGGGGELGEWGRGETKPGTERAPLAACTLQLNESSSIATSIHKVAKRSTQSSL